MPTTAVFLLGAPRIEHHGVPIKVDTRKALALFAYLAVSESRHARDELAGLFWPDSDHVSGRAALRRTLSTLNRAIDGDWLVADREAIGLRRDSNLWIDLDAYRQLLASCRTHGHAESAACDACLAPLNMAVDLSRGDFLAGFEIRDSPGFDDWRFLQAEGIRCEQSNALDRLARCLTIRGQLDLAITAGRRWLAMDPLHEPAHCRLMELYARSGQFGSLVRQYRECVRILDEELGVAPLESTTRLFESAKARRGQRRPAATLAGSTSRGRTRTGEATTSPVEPTSQLAPPRFPLVGRSAEWDVLRRAYAEVGPAGRLVVIAGEAGIGKTRLAEEFVGDARRRGATILHARCFEGDTRLAYAPLVEVLRSVLRDPRVADRIAALSGAALNEAARLVPEVAAAREDLSPKLPVDSPGAQVRFFDGIITTLVALSAGSLPPILFLDDVHWADSSTIDLLAFLARRLANHPLFVLVTWRMEEMLGANPLRQLLADAERAGRGTKLTLSRLDLAAVRELIARHGAGAFQTSVDQLYVETEGLPFLVVEYLNALSDGTTEPGPEPTGAWLQQGRAHDLLRSRLNAVGDVASQILNTAAAIGRSFDFDTVRGASGRGEEETVVALEELVVRGLVREAPDDATPGRPRTTDLTYDFDHDKLRSMVYAETSQARRRLLHRRIAEVLAARARSHVDGGIDAGQIASHYQRAGEDGLASEYYRLAGERARSLYSNGEALAHFRNALALGPPGEAGSAALREAIADLLTLGGEYTAAIAEYQAAMARAPAGSSSELERKLGNVYLRRGDWDLAEAQFQDAIDALPASQSPIELSRIYSDWSLAVYRRGEMNRAVDLARQALERAQTSGEPEALTQAHNILGILRKRQGDRERARYHLEQSLEFAEAQSNVVARIAALNNLAQVYADSRDFDQATRLAETALALGTSQGDRHREAALHNNLADVLFAAGHAETAMTHLKRAVAIFAEVGIDGDTGRLQPEIWKLAEW